MDDRTYGPSDGGMRFDDFDESGEPREPREPAGPGERRGPGRGSDSGSGPDSDSTFDFEALARSLEGGDGASAGVPLIVAGGVFLALTVLAFVYDWPLWATALCVLALVAVAAAGMLRRPPVAPLELTSSERDRVRRVLGEHGVRPAVALVRALYPGESSAAAVKTVRLLLERR